MVAINRSISVLLLAFTAFVSASAQQIKPRIAGLETNEQYMSLLARDHSLTQREDSIAIVVESLREAYRSAPDESSNSREQIISLEDQLFELRSNKAMVVDSLNVIEQDWVLNNMNVPQAEVVDQTTELVITALDVKYIYESPNVKGNLSSIDYRNLVKAEEMEPLAEKLSSDYIVNYDNMLSLRRSYESTSTHGEAVEIMERFDSLAVSNQQILERLGDTWGFIYDNKSFAYSLLMELLGFDDVLQQEAELMRKAQAEISAKQSGGSASELILYLIQKSSMVEFERLVARKLELVTVEQTLAALSQKLSAVDTTPLPIISIEERSFIDYQPIEFVKTPFYNASNPIPELVIPESGVIFRIYVGSFQTKPSVATFRNTIPLAHAVNDLKRHCYYIGGFETYEEVVEAQAQLKAHGFRAPKIVVWSDGRERNLTEDPLPMPLETSYRIEISDTVTLPDGVADAVSSIAAGGVISKVGTDKFVITSLSRKNQIDSLVNRLREIAPELNMVVEKSETKIEF